MHFRKPLCAAVLVATALTGCSGREEPALDEGDDGCTGACNPNDGGPGGSDGGWACPAADAGGPGPIGRLRASGEQGHQVRLESLVVTAVDSVSPPDRFWAVDPCFPREGIYIDQDDDDPPGTYVPRLGDQVTIEGLFRRYNPIASDTSETRHAYRPVIKNDFKLGVPDVAGEVTITLTGTAPVPQDITVPAGFGNANGGATPANPEYGGARVHIPGPLTLTNPTPRALEQRPDDPEHSTYLGFEVSGGVLVSSDETFGETPDGGTTRCDWHARALDGGSISFPNGIRGVWDTYSYVPCADGGTSSSCGFEARDAGYVPGTDQPYTFILYPQNCETDLPGVYDAGTSS